jgi:antitoxin component YwqK of YwqJK toxin-antitoxin module
MSKFENSPNVEKFSNKLENFNSPEKEVLLELFEKMPMMDKWIASLIENYIYSYVREYYPSEEGGSLKCEYRTKFGLKDGECKVWYDNRQLWQQTTYIDDKVNGEYKRWYDNGQLMEQITYVDGKRQGNYKTWDNEGNLMEWINPIEV